MRTYIHNFNGHRKKKGPLLEVKEFSENQFSHRWIGTGTASAKELSQYMTHLYEKIGSREMIQYLLTRL